MEKVFPYRSFGRHDVRGHAISSLDADEREPEMKGGGEQAESDSHLTVTALREHATMWRTRGRRRLPSSTTAAFHFPYVVVELQREQRHTTTIQHE